MIQIDTRIGGVEPRYILHPDGVEVKPLVRVPDTLLESVVFIGSRSSEGVPVAGGTGFYLYKPKRGTAYGFVYLVTAKHNIDKISALGRSEVLIRCNLFDGEARWYTTNIFDWHFHPYEDEVDVAVARLRIPSEARHMALHIDGMVTSDVLIKEGIGIGDEVFLFGLFKHHHGSRRSCPIVRIGNIAALPDEKIAVPNLGLIDAYLIEVRSMGGLSGCPVLVQQGDQVLTEQDSIQAQSEGIALTRLRPLYCLGLMHGHFVTSSTTIDSAHTDADAARRDEINMGIAIVVPAHKIVEVIEQELFTKDGQTIRD